MTRQDFLNMVVLTKKLAKKTGFTDEIIAITAAELEQKYERFNKERFLNACYTEEKKEVIKK